MKQIVMLPPDASATPHTRLMFGLSSLPQAERDVLILWYHERLSLEGIAMVLEESEDEVASRFYLGHVALGLVDEESLMVGTPEALQVA